MKILLCMLLLLFGWVAFANQSPENGIARWQAEYQAQNNDTVPPIATPKPTMVAIKGGIFVMGDANGASDQMPYTTKVSDFEIAAYETTHAEFDRFVAATKYDYRPDGSPREQYPVAGIAWYDAVAYCNWLSKEHGYDTCYIIDKKNKDPNNDNSLDEMKWTVTWSRAANGYRLPTEAEWEYAARDGGKTRRYPWGDEAPNANNANWYGSGSNDDGYLIAPVGTFPKNNQNQYKLYDMAGNVWEWCWDWKGDYPNNKKKDYKGVTMGIYRVVRGGSWRNDDDSFLRVSHRGNNDPHSRTHSNIGFRIARTIR